MDIVKMRDFDSILNEWHINNEGERWSLKRQFLRNNPAYYCLDEFVDFLKQKFEYQRHLTTKTTE